MEQEGFILLPLSLGQQPLQEGRIDSCEQEYLHLQQLQLSWLLIPSSSGLCTTNAAAVAPENSASKSESVYDTKDFSLTDFKNKKLNCATSMESWLINMSRRVLNGRC